MKKAMMILLAGAMLLAAFMILPIHGEAKLYDNVIRLHVLANSDSEEDQALKLRVRDAVLQKTDALLKDAASREEAAEILQASLGELEAVAKAAVADAGYGNAVTVTLSRESYPTRQYEQLAFPAGEYLSLRVMIGEAEGQNWWCVLFPPMCLSAASGRTDAEDAFISVGLSGEQYKIITESDDTKYEVRFKILETIENARNSIGDAWR